MEAEETNARWQQFIDLLSNIHHGEPREDITAQLADLAGKVLARDRPGELVIKLVLSPAKGEDQALYISASVTSKLPPKRKGTSIYFLQEDNGLGRTPPRQATFDLGPRAVTVRQPDEDSFRVVNE
jgi:hypothetical protein